MSRYQATTELREGERLYALHDTHTGASAHVWPSFGNNCIAAELPAPGGGLVRTLLDPESLQQVRDQPSRWGVPLLFPWPGRIPGGRYRFQGREYTLPVDTSGNAGHGFVKTLPWKVEVFEAWDSAAFLRCSISSDDQPQTLEGYPFPYYFAATYRLDNDGLDLIVEAKNTSDTAMPVGFGAHPYFRLPLGEGGRQEDCLAHVPAARRWSLQRLGALAPGERLTWDDVTVPVPEEIDLRTPQALGGRHFDGGYADVDRGLGRVECWIEDPASQRQAVMQASAHFGTVVMYTPPGQPAVCFEPWTCPPNGFNVAAAGVEPSGLVTLAPGQRWEASLRMFIRRSLDGRA